MTDIDYSIRNYRSTDLKGCSDLWLLEGRDQTGHYISPQIVKAQLEKPGFSSEATVLVAEKDGDIIGCLNITPELGIKHTKIHCIVHPEYRRQGVATALFNKAAKQIVDMGANVASTDILENNSAAKTLLHKLGFKPVRQFLEMQLTLDTKPAGIADAEIVIRHLAQNEEATLTDLQNRAFAEHWGYNPNTVEEITYRLKQVDCSHRHVVFACTGDKPVGYCWTTTIPEPNPATGKKHGRIHMLGVDPEYRGKNIGKAILVAGLIFLFDSGIAIVEITADSENKKARSLYKEIGFKEQSISECYEKLLG
jgi:mycothiol synthase